jgi:sulfite reductase (NADPH) flavoprotein alpha-component
MSENTSITRDDYDRDTRHNNFDTTGTGIDYDIGDVLATYPHNDVTEVNAFLDSIKINPDQALEIERLSDVVPDLPA